MKVFRLFMMRRRRPLHSRPPVFPTMPLRRKKQIQKMTRRAMLARQTVRLPVVPRVEASVVDRVAKTEKFLLSPEGAQTDIRIAERRCFCGNFNKSVK